MEKMDLERNNNKTLETTDDQTNKPKVPSPSNNWKFIAIAIFLFVASLAGILYYNRNSLSKVVIPQKPLSEEARDDLLKRGCSPKETDQIIGAIFSDSSKLSFEDDFRHLDMDSFSNDDVIYCYWLIALNEKNDDFIEYSFEFAINHNLLTLAKVMIHSGNYKEYIGFLIRWIVESSNSSVEMFKLFLDSIEDINSLASTDILYLACEKGKFDIAALLLEKRPEILEDICFNSGYTPIQLACQDGKFEILKFLLENGANADVLNSDGLNLLHLAVRCRNITLCSTLLELKFDSEFINSVDSNSRTPLHIAYTYGDSEIIRLLLEKGASNDVTDLYGKTPISYLNVVGDAELIALFRK